MSKKQWYGVIGVFLGLVVLVFSIVFFTEKKEKDRDIVGEAQEETEKEKGKIKETVGEKLGTDEPMITRGEMQGLIEKYREDAANEGKELNENDIYEKIEEEYGLFNALAYSRDLIIENDGDKSVNTSLLNSLLFSFYFSQEPTLKDIEGIKILRTTSLERHLNSVKDSTRENFKESVPVIESDLDYLLVSDTEGFHKGKQAYVGYPVIGEGFIYSYSNKEEAKNKLDMRFSIYIEEDIKLGKFIDKVNKMKVNVGKYEAKPIGREFVGEMSNKYLEILESMGGKPEDKKVFEEYYKKQSEYRFMSYVLDGPLSVYASENDLVFSPEDGVFNLTKKDLKGYSEYIEHLKKDKILMGDTLVEVTFEIDKSAFVGDFDTDEDLKDYFIEKGHEPPVITVDGVDMKLQLVTKDLVEGKGIYYKR